MTICPCCSGKDYHCCCEPLMLCKQQAQTPEQLMRSRYTAFTQRNVDYIFSTMMDPALAKTSREETQAFVNHVTWTGLQIINAPNINALDKEGFVEFAAYYIEDDQARVLSECSKFIKIKNQWFYTDGTHKLINPDSLAVTTPGRNDLCFCGSGTKYKKCCRK